MISVSAKTSCLEFAMFHLPNRTLKGTELGHVTNGDYLERPANAQRFNCRDCDAGYENRNFA
jgi:hypothetical protein